MNLIRIYKAICFIYGTHSPYNFALLQQSVQYNTIGLPSPCYIFTVTVIRLEALKYFPVFFLCTDMRADAPGASAKQFIPALRKGADYMETKTITDIISLDSILGMVESAKGIEENLVLNKITRSIAYNIRRMASEKFDTKISEETAEELYQQYLLEDITGLIKHNLRIGINIGSKLQAEMLGL